MWRTARCKSGIHGALIAALFACLSLVIILSPSSGAAARRGHWRTRAVAPRTAHHAVRQPPATVLNPNQEILASLENGERTLEKQTSDLGAALQRQMSQMTSSIEDTGRATQQLLKQTENIESLRRLLTVVIVLLLLLCGGVLYIAWQLPSLPDRGLAWKGNIPDVPKPGTEEEGIVGGLRVRPRNSSSSSPR